MNFGRFDQGTGRRILSSADERGWMSSYFIHKCNSLHQIFRIIVKINSFNTLLSLLLCMFWNTPLSRGTASREGERRLLSHRHELLGWKHTHHVVILKKPQKQTNMGHVMIQHCCCCCFFFLYLAACQVCGIYLCDVYRSILNAVRLSQTILMDWASLKKWLQLTDRLTGLTKALSEKYFSSLSILHRPRRFRETICVICKKPIKVPASHGFG